MSRSVSTHSHAVATVYLNNPWGDEFDPDFSWDEFVSDLCDNVIKPAYPSFSSCNRWDGREDHVILENRRAEVSVSEYNGIVSVCLAPLDPDNQLDRGWAERVAASFKAKVQKAFPSSALVSQGRFSNGEQCFTLASVPGSVVTSKEGRLPMFP